MSSLNKNKEIQVQRPAQSLQAFRNRYETGQSARMDIIKPALIATGVVLVVALGFFGYRSWSSRSVQKHEEALADLLLAVQGDPKTPSQPADLEKRLRQNLPRLEALAKSAPSSQKALTEGMLRTWHLELDGKGEALPQAADPWSRLGLAQRQIALGQGQEALATLEPLRAGAKPGEAWGELYWRTLMNARALRGEREQALKDYAEYKQRYRDQADIHGMETLLTGI